MYFSERERERERERETLARTDHGQLTLQLQKCSLLNYLIE